MQIFVFVGTKNMKNRERCRINEEIEAGQDKKDKAKKQKNGDVRCDILKIPAEYSQTIAGTLVPPWHKARAVKPGCPHAAKVWETTKPVGACSLCCQGMEGKLPVQVCCPYPSATDAKGMSPAGRVRRWRAPAPSWSHTFRVCGTAQKVIFSSFKKNKSQTKGDEKTA